MSDTDVYSLAPVTTDVKQDSLWQNEILPALSSDRLGSLLYGSRARGAHRPDSDVDVLQLVPSCPRSYSRGRVNVTSYTPDHLIHLARRGSLFVCHLWQEGVILEDPFGTLSTILRNYKAPTSYDPLKTEMAVVLAATATLRPEDFSTGMLRLAIYATRTMLYINAAELASLTFDTQRAANACGVPELASLLRTRRSQDGPVLSVIGQQLLSTDPPEDIPADLPSIAVWSIARFPLAAQLLQLAIAGESQIPYTILTLPLG